MNTLSYLTRALIFVAASGAVGCSPEDAQISTPAPWVEAEVRYQIGTGSDGLELGRPAAVRVATDGRLWVLDAFDQTLHAFDSTGAHLYSALGQGQGPGEAMGAAGVARADGLVAVWDPRLGRITLLDDRTGSVVGTVDRPGAGSIYPWPGAILPDGRVVDWTLDRTLDETLAQSWIVEIDAPPVQGVSFSLRRLRTPSGMNIPFGLRSLVGTDGDLLVHLNPATYEILVASTSGDSQTFPSPTWLAPLPVDRATSDSIGVLRDSLGLPPVPPETIPNHREVVWALMVEGGLIYSFVRDVHSPVGDAMDVFSSDGLFSGRVTLPDAPETASPARPAAAGHWVAYVRSDPIGRPIVVVVKHDLPLE